MLLEYKDRHELPDEDAIVLFDHITRTGGTDLKRMFKSHFGGNFLPNLQPPASIIAYLNPRMEDLGGIAGHAVRGIHGLLPRQRKAFYITFLRHPLQRWLSFYRKQNKKFRLNKTMESYLYGMNERNFLINWLGHGDSSRAEQKLFEQYLFFGITELYAESIYELSAFFPWMKNQTVIPHTNATIPDKMPLDKLAEEYFLENNAGDMELYDKALKEFKRRFPEPPGLGVMRTESAARLITKFNRPRKSTPLDALYDLPVDIVPIAGEIGFAHYNLLKTASFFYASTHNHYDKADAYGNAVFDVLDKMDGQNQIEAVVLLRLRMIEAFCSLPGNRNINMPGTFSGRCRSWLLSLKALPEWRNSTLNAEMRLLQKHGESDAALISVRNAVAADSENFYFHKMLSDLLISTGAVAEAAAMARDELTRNPDSEWALRQLSLALLSGGDWAEAEASIKKALKKNPFWKKGIMQLLNFPDLLSDDFLLSTAENFVREILSWDSDAQEEFYFTLSRISGAHGKIAEGLEYARRAYALQPWKRAFTENLAHFLRLAGNNGEFEEFCREALERDPRQGWVWRERCRMAEARGNRALALELGMKALQVHPEDSDFRRYYNTLVSSPA